MFAEGFAVSGHCWEFFLLSCYHLSSVFLGAGFSVPAPALFFSLQQVTDLHS